MSKKLLKRQKHDVLGPSLGFGVLVLLGGGSHPLGFFSLSFQNSLDPFWSPLTKPSPWSKSTLLTLPPATLSFFPLNQLISLETLPKKKKKMSHLKCSVIKSWCLWHPSIIWDPCKVKDSSWLGPFPLVAVPV